jgi:single-stranded DNA-specific DHH superfamily exonuclease
MQKFLTSCRSPADVLAENMGTAGFREHIFEMRHKFDTLLEAAQAEFKGDVLFFEYGGDLSISSELSNALSYYNKDKHIAVAFKKGGIVNISLRGKGAKKILESILPQIPNSNGGGHENAVGARIPVTELDKFKELFLEAVKKVK